MQRTHHKLVGGLPESQVTLSFSADGRFTPPSSSSTETFFKASGDGAVSDTYYVECHQPGENQGVPGLSACDAIPRKDYGLRAMEGRTHVNAWNSNATTGSSCLVQRLMHIVLWSRERVL